jgi:rhodanese-related sulfurtransferase
MIKSKEANMKRFKITAMCTFALFMAVAFSGISFAGDLGAIYSKDWTPEQIKAFAKKPWTAKEKALMGDPDLGYLIDKENFPMEKITGKNLTAKQLSQNGRAVWLPIFLQFGLGMNMKTFKKVWIDEGKWKDPKHVLLDVRMESEFLQGHVPGAIRLDTGLDFWYLPILAPDSTATYYLQCKSGAPADGGVRGALVARHMRMMGYSGEIYNLTDGFRGWIENGFPAINRHGQFTLVPGTFQKPDPYFNKGTKTLKFSPQP